MRTEELPTYAQRTPGPTYWHADPGAFSVFSIKRMPYLVKCGYSIHALRRPRAITSLYCPRSAGSRVLAGHADPGGSVVPEPLPEGNEQHPVLEGRLHGRPRRTSSAPPTTQRGHQLAEAARAGGPPPVPGPGLGQRCRVRGSQQHLLGPQAAVTGQRSTVGRHRVTHGRGRDARPHGDDTTCAPHPEGRRKAQAHVPFTGGKQLVPGADPAVPARAPPDAGAPTARSAAGPFGFRRGQRPGSKRPSMMVQPASTTRLVPVT